MLSPASLQRCFRMVVRRREGLALLAKGQCHGLKAHVSIHSHHDMSSASNCDRAYWKRRACRELRQSRLQLFSPSLLQPQVLACVWQGVGDHTCTNVLRLLAAISVHLTCLHVLTTYHDPNLDLDHDLDCTFLIPDPDKSISGVGLINRVSFWQ